MNTFDITLFDIMSISIYLCVCAYYKHVSFVPVYKQLDEVHRNVRAVFSRFVF